jgi:putative ABC transport system ATP-binding protein
MTAWIATRDVRRYYKRGRYEVRAVDGVTIDVDRGDLVAVVGASGSGKSTLLNLLAGLDRPTAGHVEVGGRRLDGMGRRELARYRAKSVGMVFQSFNLLAHQTALRNVELALIFDGTPRRLRQEKAREILVRLGLEDRLAHRPGDLSGGEQQRVAVARALVKGPEVLFADEPTGNLDEENTRAIMDLLVSLNRDGLTVLMVTHDVEVAKRTAGRVLRMHYGRLVDGESDTGGAPKVGGTSDTGGAPDARREPGTGGVPDGEGRT